MMVFMNGLFPRVPVAKKKLCAPGCGGQSFPCSESRILTRWGQAESAVGRVRRYREDSVQRSAFRVQACSVQREACSVKREENRRDGRLGGYKLAGWRVRCSRFFLRAFGVPTRGASRLVPASHGMGRRNRIASTGSRVPNRHQGEFHDTNAYAACGRRGPSGLGPVLHHD
jgi:hypothetical protein